MFSSRYVGHALACWLLATLLAAPGALAARTWEQLEEKMETPANTFTELDASNIPLGSGGTPASDHWMNFLDLLTPHAHFLVTLNLSNTNMTAANFISLANIFNSPGAQLQTLILDSNPLSAAAENLLPIFTQITSLVTLSAQNCTLIQSDLIKRFVEWTNGENPSLLETVTLTNSPLLIAPGEIEAHIKWGSTLRTLGIGGTGLPSKRVTIFLHLLTLGTRPDPLALTTLDISGTLWDVPRVTSDTILLDFASLLPNLETLVSQDVSFSGTGSFWTHYSPAFTFPPSLSLLDISRVKGLPSPICSTFAGISAIIAHGWTLADTMALLRGLKTPPTPPSSSWQLTLDLSHSKLTTASTLPIPGHLTWCESAAQIPQLSRFLLAGCPLGLAGVLHLTSAFKDFWSSADPQESILDVSFTWGGGPRTAPNIHALFRSLLSTGATWIVIGGNNLGVLAGKFLSQMLVDASAPSSPQQSFSPSYQLPIPGISAWSLPPYFLAMNSDQPTIASFIGPVLEALIPLSQQSSALFLSRTLQPMDIRRKVTLSSMDHFTKKLA